MATITLLCGLPCAGKTTLAKQLERDRPALRLSEDDWVCRLYHPAEPHHDDRRIAIKEVQWDIAVRAAQLGSDVVLDWGMWTRAERDDFRARAVARGVGFELRYLDTPLDELVRRQRRVARRCRRTSSRYQRPNCGRGRGSSSRRGRMSWDRRLWEALDLGRQDMAESSLRR